MEVDQKEPAVQSQTPAEQEQQSTPPIENPAAILEKNKQLLAEAKLAKERAREAEEKLRDIDLREKEARGEHQSVIQALREENAKIKKEKDDTKKDFAYSRFEEQIKNEAVKNGCANPDKLLRLMSKEQIASVEMDDRFNVNMQDLTRLMGQLKEQHSDIGMFKPVTINHTPLSVGKTATVSGKSLDEMSIQELQAKWAELEK